MAVDAFPGLGKTTSVLAFARDFHQREIEESGPFTSQGHERIPVCRVGLTGNTGMKDLNRAMLEFFGHPGQGGAPPPSSDGGCWTACCPAMSDWWFWTICTF